MSRAYLLVESQTGGAFISELLVPHYAQVRFHPTPITVSTNPGYRDGVISFARIKPRIERPYKQDNGAHVIMLFDLYTLPDDSPGRSSMA